MTTRARRGLTAAALCTAGLVVAGAPLVASGHNHPPAKKTHKPSYGVPGKPGKPGTVPGNFRVRPATLFARLNGRGEFGRRGEFTRGRHKGGGDPDGQGGATITITSGRTLCFAMTVQGLDTPTAAQIQVGRRWQKGPVVAVLTPPATGDPGTAAGCIPNVAPDLLRALRSHSRKFYVNVLTAAYPQGAVRGQLVR